MGNIFSIRLTDEDKIHLQQRIDLMYIFILQFVQYRFKHRICFIFNGKLNGKCLRW